MRKYVHLISDPISQIEKLDSSQAMNNAGGYVFVIDDWKKLERFLILGSSENSYYQKAKDLTRENAQVVERCYTADVDRTINCIVSVSEEGRAPKNDPAIFALAIGANHADEKVRQKALAAMPKVCRTGTHLFYFVEVTRALGRGWGRALKNAVAHWYDYRPIHSLGYQVIKYRQRDNYNHKRLLQTAHPKCVDQDPMRQTLYQWIVGKEVDTNQLPNQVQGHIAAMKSTDPVLWTNLTHAYNLPWEALPTEANTEPEVWKALLPKMGLTALIRNLGNMTRLGVIKPLSKEERTVVERLGDQEALKNERIHPFNVLVAKAVYESGKGLRGTNTWCPSTLVVDALEKAFYASFKYVEPANKRTLIGLDVSQSMTWGSIMNSPLTPAQGAAAMLMTVARTEPWHVVMAFDSGLRKLNINASDSLNEVLRETAINNGGGTDCALPIIYAQQNKLEVDTFQIYTDNETWAGHIHPVKALQEYRRVSGIPAKLIVTAFTSTGFSIADPNDGGMLDLVGFDASAPALMAEFARS